MRLIEALGKRKWQIQSQVGVSSRDGPVESRASEEIVLREDSVMTTSVLKLGIRSPLCSFFVEVLFNCTCEVGVEISRKPIVQHGKLLFS